MKSRYLLSVVCLFSASQAVAQTDSPYARFGYEGKVLRTPQERQQRMMLLVPNPDTASAIAKVGLDPANQRYYLFDKQNQVLHTDTLAATAVARFLSMDPLTKQFPELTPYQYATNRPIDGIDMDGLEWKSQHSWGDAITNRAHIKSLGSDYVKGMTYQDAWGKTAPKLLEKRIGETFDCANLSIRTLVQFAYQNKLPIHFKDYKSGADKDPTFDNDNNGYTSKKGEWVSFKPGEWERFARNIEAHYGASDLFYNTNVATDKSWDNLAPGDLIGIRYSPTMFHSQTVKSVSRPIYWFDEYTTIQGSLEHGPNGQTSGVPAYEKSYTIDRMQDEGEKSKPRSWNFKFFDKKK